MLKSELLRAIQTEIMQHDFDCFIDEAPSRVQGGRGSVVPGCPRCKKRVGTMPQFLDHLANDAIPALFDRLSEEGNTDGG